MTENSSAGAEPSGMDAWFTPRRFALMLGLMICVSFPRVITGTGTFFLRDFSLFSYPLAWYQRECFWHGELPLWTPMNYCGLPFLAQWNTLCLYPLSLFYLLLPFTWALGVFCLGHLFLGGMGMYFLAHRWTGNRFAAATGGVAFAFTAVMLNFLMWPGNVAAMGWLPWVVLCVEKAWTDGGRALIIAAMVGVLQMLAGAPEVVMQTWGFLAALFLLEWVREKKIRGRMLVRFVAVVMLITGLAAAQLFPFLDLLQHSHRDTGFGDSTWSMPLWGWANYVLPLFGCVAPAPGIYSQPGQYWIFSYYLGIGTLALAMLAAWRVRQARVWLLAGLTSLCLLLALGDAGMVYPLLRKVLPVLGFMRYPVKFVILPAFSGPLLAAIFVGQTRSCSGELWPRLQKHLWLVATSSIAAIVVLLWLSGRFPGGHGADAVRSAVGRIIFLVAILGLLAELRRPHDNQMALLWRGALLVLLWLDVPTMGAYLCPTVSPGVYQPGLAQGGGATPAPSVGAARALLSGDVARNITHLWFTNFTDQVLYNRLALSADANLLAGVPKITGVYPLLPRQMGDINWMVLNDSLPSAGLLDFLAVSYLNVPGKATEWMYRPSHLPWVTGGQNPVFADPDETLRALGRSDFNPRTTVYLPPEEQPLISVTNASTPTLTVREFGNARVLIDVEAAEPALVVISQNYYHNWRAFVDDRPALLLRANHAFQAVEVPAGRHDLRLVYRDHWFFVGAGLSLFTLAGCAAFWCATKKRGLPRASPAS